MLLKRFLKINRNKVEMNKKVAPPQDVLVWSI